MLKEKMYELMKELDGVKSDEYKMGYADGCLDMYNAAKKIAEENLEQMFSQGFCFSSFLLIDAFAFRRVFYLATTWENK